MGQTGKKHVDRYRDPLLSSENSGKAGNGSAVDPEREIGPPPFIRLDPRFTPYEWFKTVIMTPIFPIRFLMLGGFFFTYILLANLASIGTGPDKPMGRIRRAVFNSAHFFVRGMLFACGFWWIPVRGKENFGRGDKRPAIVLGNHTGWIEILTSYFMMVPSYIAKEQVKKIWLIGRMAAANDGLFVSREADARVANAKLVEKIIDRAQNWDPNGHAPQLFLFPEGTTTNGRYMLPFKRGAFEPGVPVQPIIFKVHWKHFSPTWETIGTFHHAFRLMTQFVNWMEVIVLPVRVPSDQEKADPSLFAHNVRMEMAEAGGYELLDGYGLRHKKMYHQLMKSGELTLDRYLEEYGKLEADRAHQ